MKTINRLLGLALLLTSTSAFAEDSAIHCVEQRSRAAWTLTIHDGALRAESGVPGKGSLLDDRVFHEDESAWTNSGYERIFIDESGEVLVVLPRSANPMAPFTASYQLIDQLEANFMTCKLFH